MTNIKGCCKIIYHYVPATELYTTLCSLSFPGKPYLNISSIDSEKKRTSDIGVSGKLICNNDYKGLEYSNMKLSCSHSF